MRRLFALTAVLTVLLFALFSPAAQALRHRSHHSRTNSAHSTLHHRSHSRHVSRTTSRHHSGHHTGRYHRKTTVKAAAKPKYAYPLELFMLSPPAFDQSPLPSELAQQIRRDFQQGTADQYHPNDLVRAGLVQYHPLHGGIFKRREQVKYIIVHSTETGPPVSAKSVIDAWGSLGRRHAGAQYVVDRDGTVYQSCEPDLATVHVNIFKTLPGINNDNSIGIEMNHTGRQNYPREQREAVIKLVSYLQDRYKVVNENIITHRYAQQGDHTDPVAFDFDDFLARKEEFHVKALAMKRDAAPEATVYMEMHKNVSETATSPTEVSEPTDTALKPKLRSEIELAPDSATLTPAEEKLEEKEQEQMQKQIDEAPPLVP